MISGWRRHGSCATWKFDWLKAMPPPAGTDLKGHMRSQAEWLAASGYASRPKDFDELIGILDGEIRLLTPTDPEGAGEDSLARRASEEPSESSLARRAKGGE